MGSFFGELKRRNVVRVGAAYIIVGWVVVQIGQILFESFGTPDWVIKTVIVLVAIGFPFVSVPRYRNVERAWPLALHVGPRP